MEIYVKNSSRMDLTKKILLTVMAFTSISLILNLFKIYELKENALNQENTIAPLLSVLTNKACDHTNIQVNTLFAKGSSLIYKREKIASCISGEGNRYYARCYDWDRTAEHLIIKPTKDVLIEKAYSCISEDKVNTSLFHDERVQNMTIGQTYTMNYRPPNSL
jgi:hypothetical protein